VSSDILSFIFNIRIFYCLVHRVNNINNKKEIISLYQMSSSTKHLYRYTYDGFFVQVCINQQHICQLYIIIFY